MQLSPLQRGLIERWQRGFPLVPRPFDAIAADIGVAPGEVLDALRALLAGGVLSRIGAAIRPNTVGASTLAAIAAPPDRLFEVAQIVSSEPGVNHNYEREHAFNLWFVVTGPHDVAVRHTLARIRWRTGLEVLDLPLERAYFIDLGFSLGRKAEGAVRPASAARGTEPIEISETDRQLLAALDDGLVLEPEPYRRLAAAVGLSETDAMETLARLIAAGIISRFGLIVRHRKLGYRANAMVVWDVPDDMVDELGESFARQPFVTLSYRRPRRRPYWPYNLFCMIHGKERAPVLEHIEQLRLLAPAGARHAVLFSKRCFKQRGARLSAA